MPHVVTRLPEVDELDGLRVHLVPTGEDNLTWIAVCTASGEAVAVDGPEAGPVLRAVEELGIELDAVLITHTHFDHVGLLLDLDRRGELAGLRVVGPGGADPEVPDLTEPVGEGSEVRLGRLRARVMLTEGHVDRHVCYLVGGALFCGDTLFTGGCGRAFDGPPAALFRSLLRLAELPGDTRVYCGHEYTTDNLRFAWTLEPDNPELAERIHRVWRLRGQGLPAVPSTISEERSTNPFLRVGSPTVLDHLARAVPGADLSTPLRAFAVMRALKDRGAYRSLPDAELPVG